MKSKLSLLCLLILIISGQHAFSQETQQRFTGTIYLVRHAEKDTVGRNPALSAAGKKRAGDLYRFLKDKHIGKIYTTRYLRTQMTADSLRIYQQTDTAFYNADTANAELMNKMLADKSGINFLIIGHSNTIPSLVRMFGGNLEIKELSDKSYDNIFIVEQKKKKVKLKQKKYGTATNTEEQLAPMRLQ